jgi:SNF2 family DNA or RNA helicase
MRRGKGQAKFGMWLEQGLGKTALTLNEFVESDDTDINLVIAPNSFKNDWALAPGEWGVPWMPTGYWPKYPLPFDKEYCQYAINYEAVREKDTLKQLIRLFEQRRCMLTIDESTAIKNPGTSTFRAVLELAKRAKMVRELNGTPLTQDVRDYYGQLRVLGQLNGMEPTVFRNKFAEMGGYFNKQVTGTRNQEELARILDACTFRALKKDWRADLPPKTYVPVHLEMSKRQIQHYSTMMEEFYALIEGEEITVDIILAQMGKLRQISSCVLLDHGKYHFFEEPKANPKLRATLDIVATSPGKVIVSHFYKPCGELLMEALIKEGLKPAQIKGGMTPPAVTEQKRKFNDDPECRVLVGQQGATARGHTLIGQEGRNRCSTMIFYENDFSYYWRAQMEDRNHRGAQDMPCTVYDLLVSPMCAITVDALTRKKDLAAEMDRIVAEVRKARR